MLVCALLLCLPPQDPTPPAPQPRFCHLAEAQPPGEDFAALRLAFTAANPGYDLQWLPACAGVAGGPLPRVLFVQNGQAKASVGDREAVEVGPGDLLLLRPEQGLVFTGTPDLLSVTVPEPFPAELPAVIRPDHDPRIADTPGGCANEAQAYRRLALTWDGRNGPYQYRTLNAHRVNIRDSFTHYHPLEGGFAEFYLVQGVLPGARLLTGSAAAVERAAELDTAAAKTLLTRTPLRRGDLVYLPRGVVHRGLGGVLAHVITAPGFVPGAELPVDAALHALRQRLSLTEEELPVHLPGAPFVSVRPDQGELCIEVDGEPFTRYRWQQAPRPCFWPVLGPGGTPVTRAFPLGEQAGGSKDHPHHVSLWCTHGAVDGLDFWAGKGTALVHGEPEELQSGPGVAGFSVATRWIVRGEDGAERLVLRDRRRWRIGATRRERTIDLDLELQAGPEAPVTLGDTKEGFFAMRVADALRVEGDGASGALVDSEGRAGKAVWGQRARWIHASGTVGEHTVGVALIDHPQNLRHPTTWHARTYGLLAANPFGVHDFTGSPKGSGDHVIPAGGVLRLRYRVLVYGGEPDAERVERAAADFAGR